MDTDDVTYTRLRAIADRLPDLPSIGRAEIAHGAVRLSLPSGNRHAHAVLMLCRQLNRELALAHPGYVAHGGADLEDVPLGQLRHPDVMVFAEEALGAEGSAFRPSEVILVVEVVSKSNPESDYEEKVRDYAAMGIPLYLLVDPRVGTGIVHSGPKYASVERFAFGDKVKVGPWQLDTGVLLTYGP
jgi:Uma2 family endonuclease